MRKSLQTLFLSIFIVMIILMICLGFLWGPLNPFAWIGIAILVAVPYVHKKLTAGNYIAWKDDMSVGVDVIDEDHKKLIDLANKVQQAVDYHMGESFERAALNELVDWTKYHFEREEGLMEQAGYTDLEEHKSEHKSMIAKVGDYIEAYDKDRGATVDRMSNFLKTWLINHIRGTDRKYMSAMQAKGIH